MQDIKEEENRKKMEALQVKQREAKEAAQVRQHALEQQQKEEHARKTAEDSRKEASLLRSKSKSKDDRQTVEKQREQEILTQFRQWTGASDEVGRHYLSAHNWKLEDSVREYFGRAND
jgi:hypothetical protein